ncbi:hypothetical protein L6452_37834 [Arctium lappa]|uniref:Uncharacterized protein n=1 Tax=Arctium lappa TaxID=4217 RepID=A0ACB8Y5J6_ARCLA|nr:hypothetical protein L6452_37834 [Arctium lappa]
MGSTFAKCTVRMVVVLAIGVRVDLIGGMLGYLVGVVIEDGGDDGTMREKVPFPFSLPDLFASLHGSAPLVNRSTIVPLCFRFYIDFFFFLLHFSRGGNRYAFLLRFSQEMGGIDLPPSSFSLRVFIIHC